MSKIKLKVSLTHNNIKEINENYKGILINNIIKYNDQETTTTLDLKNNILKRKNKEYQIILDFNNNECMYIYKTMGIPMYIKKIEIKNEKNTYYIKYIIDFGNGDIDTFIYNIDYEVDV